MNLLTKTEAGLQMLKTNLRLPEGKCVLEGRGELGAWDEHTRCYVYCV